MAITFPLALPTEPSPSRIRFTPYAMVSVGVSPFTGHQQVYEHQGQLWKLDFDLPPMQRADAEEWIAFLLSLNGRYGTFAMGDPAGATPRGVATGTPLVKGASQTGKVLLTDGWTISTTNIMRKGDYIQLGTSLHKLMKDVNSDSGGNATLDIWPRLRASPADNATITVSNCKGLFRLTKNEMVWEISVGLEYGFSIEAVEAL